MRNKILLLFLLGISFFASANEYHVDCNNQSKGDGTISNPFKTISQAAKIMKAGDVCYIHKGTYRENINPKNSGKGKRLITYTNYKDDIVIVTATEKVENWETFIDVAGAHWVYTDLVKYFQFWKDLKGTRTEFSSNDEDILTDTYVDGNKAYVLISNLSDVDKDLDIKVHEARGLKLSKITVSHIYANDKEEAIWDKFELKNTSKVNIGREATMILTYEYNRKIKQNETTKETKYFADDYLKAITSNTPIDVAINGVDKAKIGETILRLGIGRNHGLSLRPKLMVNGNIVKVPANWRGDDQSTRKQFFGVIEIPVPYKFIKENNDISITFEDDGGHVSSISMQHFAHSVKPKKPLKSL